MDAGRPPIELHCASVVTPTSSADAGLGGCPVGCRNGFFSGHLYAFCDALATFAEARANCNAHGLDLAGIDSAEENDWLQVGAFGTALEGRVWVGGTDVVQEGAWHWPDGTQFWEGLATGMPVDDQYTNFRPTEPNDQDAKEDCLILLSEGTWNDDECIARRGYICESSGL
jgi:hypothetical protein